MGRNSVLDQSSTSHKSVVFSSHFLRPSQVETERMHRWEQKKRKVEISEKIVLGGDMLPLWRRLRLWYASCVISTSSHASTQQIYINAKEDYEYLLSCMSRDARSLTRIGSCHTSAGAQGKETRMQTCGTRRKLELNMISPSKGRRITVKSRCYSGCRVALVRVNYILDKMFPPTKKSKSPKD
ncbi:hypothetical protein MGYG_01014 [Nannizzia gypsea CBS 118893]|uniref:Uncharacterized protein n=1 Tax=Arthroderma gypseum (strain ATCC MYA-4604 / CBS 118893) TaxID=535722 RepID=E5R3R8_ARTGP|nr:hypothetical protein MGYG_01014 [Nannizzia gypsea CBS 118893]EFQ97978.1 hypothetical protein MGYG_01014 [Nannizzia gypsea CBS 118893]